MFLSDLAPDECNSFLGLAHLAMGIDGNIDDSEREVFESYKYECQQSNYSYNNETLEALVDKLKDSSSQSKKIILMELMGIWAADKKWDDGELEMMYCIAKHFDIPETMANRLRRWAKEMRELIAEGCELIAR